MVTKIQSAFILRPDIGHTAVLVYCSNNSQEVIKSFSGPAVCKTGCITTRANFSDYIIKTLSSEEAIQFPIEVFMKETHKLVHTYANMRAAKGEMDFAPYAEYCALLGSLFGDKPMAAIQLQWACNSLNWFLTDFKEIVHPLSNLLVKAIERSDSGEITASLMDLEIAKFFADRLSPSTKLSAVVMQRLVFDENISAKFALQIDDGSTDLLPEGVPAFRIQCSKDDVSLLSSGRTEKKLEWLNNQIYNSIADLIKPTSITVEMQSGRPVFQLEITDPVMCFILEYMSPEKKYASCPYCGALLNGKKYCNKSHQDKYRQQTPGGKLNNLLRQWRSRKNNMLDNNQIDELEKAGLDMIDHGKDYETEVLPHLKLLKRGMGE